MSDTEFNENLSENEQYSDDDSISEAGSDNELNDENIENTDNIFKDTTTNVPTVLESLDDDDDELDERFDKIANASQVYHAKHNTISRQKMLPLLTVKRDKNNMIIDDNHKTTPLLTKYEKSKVIGLRAVQLANGLKPFIEVPSDVIEPTVIADMELQQKKIPFILKRPVSLTHFEYWPIGELEII